MPTTTRTRHAILLAGELPISDVLLPDGSLWSHAATFGEFVYRGQPLEITPEKVDNFIRVFTSGFPSKLPVDYDHGSTSAADGRQPVPKAGDILQLANVRAVDELTAPMRAEIQKAGRAIDDPRNLGLWIRWKPTPRALQLLAAGEYTEMSVTFYEDYPNNRTGESQGPTMISVALTNRPFLDGMVSIALSRDAAGPSGTADAPREQQQGGITMKGFTRLSALFGRPVETEDDVAAEATRAIEERDKKITALSAHADGFRALSAELGETDPQKAVAKIKELKQQVQASQEATEREREKALAAQIDGILKSHEDKYVPAEKEYLAANLKRELTAGTKAGETPTEKMLSARPKHGITGQHTGADTGNGNAPVDVQIAMRANALLAEDATLKALDAKDHMAALTEATVRARRELARS